MIFSATDLPTVTMWSSLLPAVFQIITHFKFTIMNIYVSNLDLQTKEDALRSLFAAHGEVSSAKIIMDKFTGSSRGFAFVEMPDDAAGTTAIAQINNQDFEGKKLSASVARPREERQGSYPVGNSYKKRF